MTLIYVQQILFNQCTLKLLNSAEQKWGVQKCKRKENQRKDLLSTRFNNKCNLLRRNEDNKANQQYRYAGDGCPEAIKTLCRVLALEKRKQLFHRPDFTPLTARVTYNHQLKPSHQPQISFTSMS